MSKVQILRGMNDILPNEVYKWQFFEDLMKHTLCNYGYREIRLPILEKSELFHRSVGESTDIVEKETYNFIDRNGDSLTLRPEGTVGCVRAIIENSLVRHNQLQKIWYMGPMFRYERPQKGRYRQFYQLGVEVYGNDHVIQEAEILSLTWNLWKNLGLDSHVTLELNSLGTLENHTTYVKALTNYLIPLRDKLDEDSQRRLSKNPLRILDSKNESTQKLLNGAPIFSDFIDRDIKHNFNLLVKYLKKLEIPVKINSRLVRGLDYYCNTVFEWVTDKLGAKNAICAGGRYDTLVNDLGGPETAAVGFAMGVERIILLMEKLNLFSSPKHLVDIYVITDKSSAFEAMLIVENLRIFFPTLIVHVNTSFGSFKSQFKKADKSGAKIALVIGDNEIQTNMCIVKFLRESKGQISINKFALHEYLSEFFA